MNDLAITRSGDAALFPLGFVRNSADYILSQQLEDGSIPWFEGGYADPWDHVEAAMGLSIAGEFAAAERAYRWLADIQLQDGSWWAAYKDGAVHNRERRESNFVAYVATGIWHHYLITDDVNFLHRYWPTVDKAVEFVLGLQTEHGEIHWAVDSDNVAREDALITGCSSIYKSLECAINIACTLGYSRPHWLSGRVALGAALREKPHRFDRTWESKARFSMDWFYPVLTGVFAGSAARARLRKKWDEFVVAGLGCRCVNDEPWVTVAESCELTMALVAAGESGRAAKLYRGLHRWQDCDGGYWTGYVYRDKAIWPEEKTTWTVGAMLLAADALAGLTPARGLFTSVRLVSDPAQDAESVDCLHQLELSGSQG
ncbi:Prenyltransferase and squalene oxidase repeat-containing protein [Microbulbifer donghaiensis]|uniref:Prenyltransferase and squalene oxidase repeat-containing protein n=1 Tax=Microbulbifer donghaiensis TaxID=494016 RepID=A0A1M4WB24_9GAMM|nr:prenyltransferase/squalene oxidase repeat-containing protein [Microbulbifer donghaiensis]SHE78468.1 Prenyltransferase and squalene oxidase repeat-containing protein [Microbulbifer donghaiensis]